MESANPAENEDTVRIIGSWVPTLLKYIKCLFLVLYHPII